jgi:signal peptidase II
MNQTEPGMNQNPRTSPSLRTVVILTVAATAGVLDQVTKWIAAQVLLPDESLEIIPGLLNLKLRANPHGAFGLFADLPEGLRLPILLALSVLAMFAIVTYSVKTLGWNMTTSVSLGLILGGAVSNLVDRVARGEVPDFLDIHIGNRAHWPTFNLADIAITVGSFILVGTLLHTWFKRMKLDETNTGT